MFWERDWIEQKACIYCTWENFGGRKFWRINGSKVFGKEKFGEPVDSLLKTLAFINIGELPTVRQICQNFPPPKFSHTENAVSLRIITGIRVNSYCGLKACIHGNNYFAGIGQYPVHALNSFGVRVMGTRNVLYWGRSLPMDCSLFSLRWVC